MIHIAFVALHDLAASFAQANSSACFYLSMWPLINLWRSIA